MRIISRKRLEDASVLYPKARTKFRSWFFVAKAARWHHFVHTRATFAHADQVKVASGKVVTVFNVSNAFRLITAIHYNRQIVFILSVMTHAEYKRDDWKKLL